MGRREGRLVEHMGEVVRDVSSWWTSRNILVSGRNILTIRINK
jgi:hypothetical protein